MISLIKDIRSQFADTMLEVGIADERLIVIVGDISHFKLQPFAKAAPGRFFNIGILEPTMVSMSAGFAKAGCLPVVHTIAPFLLERSFEQIKLDFGYQKLPGNLVTVGSAFDYAALGCTHHCYGDFALMKTIPNTEIVFPASPLEFDELFKQAYSNDRLTVYRIPGCAHHVELARDDIRLGGAMRVAEGADISLIVTGPELDAAVEVRRLLVHRGRSVEIVYVHTIAPLDRATIRASVEKTRRVVVVEEHVRSGGLGLDVLEAVYDVAGVRFAAKCLPDAFQRDYGVYEDHVRHLGFDPPGIMETIERVFAE